MIKLKKLPAKLKSFKDSPCMSARRVLAEKGEISLVTLGILTFLTAVLLQTVSLVTQKRSLSPAKKAASSCDVNCCQSRIDQNWCACDAVSFSCSDHCSGTSVPCCCSRKWVKKLDERGQYVDCVAEGNTCGPCGSGSGCPVQPTSPPAPTNTPVPTPTPVCTPNLWDSTNCRRCFSNGSGWSANCSDWGNLKDPGFNETLWNSCACRCQSINCPTTPTPTKTPTPTNTPTSTPTRVPPTLTPTRRPTQPPPTPIPSLCPKERKIVFIIDPYCTADNSVCQSQGVTVKGKAKDLVDKLEVRPGGDIKVAVVAATSTTCQMGQARTACGFSDNPTTIKSAIDSVNFVKPANADWGGGNISGALQKANELLGTGSNFYGSVVLFVGSYTDTLFGGINMHVSRAEELRIQGRCVFLVDFGYGGSLCQNLRTRIFGTDNTISCTNGNCDMATLATSFFKNKTCQNCSSTGEVPPEPVAKTCQGELTVTGTGDQALNLYEISFPQTGTYKFHYGHEKNCGEEQCNPVRYEIFYDKNNDGNYSESENIYLSCCKDSSLDGCYCSQTLDRLTRCNPSSVPNCPTPFDVCDSTSHYVAGHGDVNITVPGNNKVLVKVFSAKDPYKHPEFLCSPTLAPKQPMQNWQFKFFCGRETPTPTPTCNLPKNIVLVLNPEPIYLINPYCTSGDGEIIRGMATKLVNQLDFSSGVKVAVINSKFTNGCTDNYCGAETLIGLSADKNAILSAISRFNCEPQGGGGNLIGGIKRAKNVLEQAGGGSDSKVIILGAFGSPYGAVQNDEFWLEEIKRRGICVNEVAFGDGNNDFRGRGSLAGECHNATPPPSPDEEKARVLCWASQNTSGNGKLISVVDPKNQSQINSAFDDLWKNVICGSQSCTSRTPPAEYRVPLRCDQEGSASGDKSLFTYEVTMPQGSRTFPFCFHHNNELPYPIPTPYHNSCLYWERPDQPGTGNNGCTMSKFEIFYDKDNDGLYEDNEHEKERIYVSSCDDQESKWTPCSSSSSWWIDCGVCEAHPYPFVDGSGCKTISYNPDTSNGSQRFLVRIQSVDAGNMDFFARSCIPERCQRPWPPHHPFDFTVFCPGTTTITPTPTPKVCPIDVMLVIDTSGTITQGYPGGGDSRHNIDISLEETKKFIHNFEINNDGMKVGIVHFSSKAELVSGISGNKTNIEERISHICPRPYPNIPEGDRVCNGSTNIVAGIALAREEIRRNGRPNRPHIIILLTDGEQNVGNISPVDEAMTAKAEGIEIFVVGVGISPEREMLGKVASNCGRGSHYFPINNYSQLGNTFNQLLKNCSTCSDLTTTTPPERPTPTIPRGTDVTPGRPTLTPTPRQRVTVSPTPAGRVTLTPTPTPSGKKWTFILYLNGNGELGGKQSQTLDTIRDYITNFKNGLGHLYLNNLNIVALYARENMHRHFRWDSSSQTLTDEIGGEKREMGDPGTLSSLITQAVSLYRNDYYLLSIADEGRGTTGISWDNKDYLTPTELSSVLNTFFSALKKLDILFYDASSMQMLEETYQVKNNTRYLIGSQNLSYAFYAYDQYLRLIEEDATPEGLAKNMARTYANLSLREAPLEPLPITISVLDLEKTESVLEKLNNLASKMIAEKENQCLSLSRLQTQKFDSQDYFKLTNSDAYLDLYDFALKLKINCQGEIASLAEELTLTKQDLVATNYRRKGKYNGYETWELVDASGVSLYFPETVNDPDLKNYVNQQIFTLTQNSQWDDFLVAYFGQEAINQAPEVPFPEIAPMFDPEVAGAQITLLSSPDILNCKPCPDGTKAVKDTASFDCKAKAKNLSNFVNWLGQYSEIIRGEEIPEDKYYADYNCDGKVDINDFWVWFGQFLGKKK